jgi:rifampin ADP-ribosyltransferase
VTNPIFPGRSFFHGTKANLRHGDLINAGHNSNYGNREMSSHVYLSGTLNAAIWGAELAVGDLPGRIYVVEPTGLIEDDPDLTDKKYPGNPTMSYRTREPIRVIGEVVDWQGHSAEELNQMKAGVERARQRVVEGGEG